MIETSDSSQLNVRFQSLSGTVSCGRPFAESGLPGPLAGQGAAAEGGTRQKGSLRGNTMIHVIGDAFVYIRPEGVVDVKTLQRIAAQLERIEQERPELIRRLTDISNVTDARLTFYDFTRYSEERTYPSGSFQCKTAFFVESNAQYGFARMCQTVMENTQNTIRIFREMNEAARWLEISLIPLEEQGWYPSGGPP